MLACLLIAAAASTAPQVTFESLLAEMTDLRARAEFPNPPWTCRQFSSYDRASLTPDDPEGWFANDDRGQFLRFEQRGERREAVMMDAEGPGAIVRIWSANAKGTIRFYLDGDQAPTIEMPMTKLLSGDGPVGEPLSAVRSRGWNTYLPIPYAKHCVVTCDDPQILYYQINYRTYPEGVEVSSFDQDWFEQKEKAIAQANEALLDPEPQHLYRSRIAEILEPGEDAQLFQMASPGIIAELWLQVDAKDLQQALRHCILIGEFDGVETIHCPLGDFFGTAPGLNSYHSFPMTVGEDGALISRWAMPFAQSGSLRMVNAGEEPLEMKGWVGTDDYLFGERSMHFHATWRAEGPVESQPPRDFTYATINGQGVWAGDALHIANPTWVWWGEGDEKIYVDGDIFPSHFGTGTEDYYGYAWCDPTLFSAPLHGQTRCDGPGNFGFTSLYRFRGLDAIPFTDWLRFDMEIWHWRNVVIHQAATSYFYTRPGAVVAPSGVDRARLEIPAKELQVFRRHGAIEAEELTVTRKSAGARASLQTLGDGAEGTWSGMRQLFVQSDGLQEAVTLRVPVDEPGRYEVILYLTESFDYGVLQPAIDRKAAGKPIDTFHSEDPDAVGVPKAHSLGVHEFDSGGFDLTITVIDSNPQTKAPGTLWGLDCLVLRRVEG